MESKNRQYLLTACTACKRVKHFGTTVVNGVVEKKAYWERLSKLDYYSRVEPNLDRVVLKRILCPDCLAAQSQQASPAEPERRSFLGRLFGSFLSRNTTAVA